MGEVSKRIFEKPKRDRNGVIRCRTMEDQYTCRYADHLRMMKQQEYDRLGMMTDAEREILFRKERGNKDFIAYFRSVIWKNHPESGPKVHSLWKRVCDILVEYSEGKPIPFNSINAGWLTDFKYHLMKLDYLKRKGTISHNTASQYFAILKAALKMAYVDDYFPVNIAEKVSGINANPCRREVLTMDEVRMLIQTPCEYDVLRRASIFSILTGIRHCDIKALTWSNLVNVDGVWRVDFIQEKTGGVEYLPISDVAYSLCGERKDPNRYVFEDLPEPSWISKPLKKWVESAGITKHITFHCFRHTYATLQLTMGTDIFTVSKMLGHTKVTTTQIYAKIVDSKKVAAANAIQIEVDDGIQKTIKPARRKI